MKNIGIDIVKNNRFQEMLNDSRKYSRILSEKEIEVFLSFSNNQRKLEYIASRFACKEAIFKVLNKTKFHFDFNKVSILNDESNAPYVLFEEKVDFEILISISHSEDDSIAIALLQ